MNKKYTILLAVVSILYVVYHLSTLVYSPLPWFDEVSFVSITESYLKNHTFYESPRQLLIPEQKLNYGPIYFILQAFVMKAIGFSIFNFRISNMLLGFVDLFLIYKICRLFKFTSLATVITLVFIALEPNFNQFLHSGRMDYLMLFFFMSAYLIFAGIDADKKGYFILNSILVGVLLSCAILTNPRMIFAYSAFVCYFFFEMVNKKGNERGRVFLKYILIFAAFCGVYLIWVFSAYGGIGGYIYNNFQHSAVMTEHIGLGTSFHLKYNLLIYLFAVIAFLLLVKNKILLKNIDLALLCFPSVIAFLLIVTGGISGRYYALVAPFTTLLIVGVSVSILNSKPLRYITYTFCIAFAGIFIFKGAFILSTLEQHDPVRNEKNISQYLDKNSSICGNFQFYYIALHNNCSFVSLEENINPKTIIDSNSIKYYIIGKGCSIRKPVERFLGERYKLKVILEDKNYSPFFSKIIRLLPYHINEGYACYIYERIDG